MKFTPKIKAEYEDLFATCTIRDIKLEAVDTLITRVLANRERYEQTGNPLAIPWYFIAAIHNLETSLRFDQHLHNGDPLTARTKRVPKGHPKTGNPPFTFEESAMDALKLKKLNTIASWPLAVLLFQLERYNGFGYRRSSININSPYLWSFSNHYKKGKFVEDGVFSASAVSAQCGGATLLKRMEARGLIEIPLNDS